MRQNCKGRSALKVSYFRFASDPPNNHNGLTIWIKHSSTKTRWDHQHLLVLILKGNQESNFGHHCLISSFLTSCMVGSPGLWNSENPFLALASLIADSGIDLENPRPLQVSVGILGSLITGFCFIAVGKRH